MKTLAFGIGLALLILASCQAEAPEPPPAYDLAAVDTLLANSLTSLGGGCVLLLLQDGRTVYEKAFGSFETSEVVPVASGTKWLSAAVIMALADRGMISLESRTSDFLPGFTGAKGLITVRQLFSHTSGLPSYHSAIYDEGITLAEAVETISGIGLEAPPGTVFIYGGVSMHVGGRMAELAGSPAAPSGQGWHGLFAQLIADPLGMTATDYLGLGDTDNPNIAGGARSSARDYGRFLTMLLNKGVYQGRRVLSEASVAEILKDQTGGVPVGFTPYSAFASLDPGLAMLRYGLGNWRELVEETTGELLESSSQGIYGFSPWIDHRRKLAGVLVVQTSWTTVMPVYLELKKLVRRIIPG